LAIGWLLDWVVENRLWGKDLLPAGCSHVQRQKRREQANIGVLIVSMVGERRIAISLADFASPSPRIIGPFFSNRADESMRIALALLLAVSGDAINFVAGLAEPKTRFYSQRLLKAPPKTSRVYKTTRQSQQP
jgi:hypothetical protein